MSPDRTIGNLVLRRIGPVVLLGAVDGAKSAVVRLDNEQITELRHILWDFQVEINSERLKQEYENRRR